MKKINEHIFITKEIISDWYLGSIGTDKTPSSEIKRSYEIWERASALICQSKDRFDLSDGISNLKRSLNHRLKLLEKIYNFKKIKINHKPKHIIELLGYFEIIRPLFLQKLLEIRNKIEHQDTDPPPKKRCEELSDVIWYFLKSTDPLLTEQRNLFEAGVTYLEEDCERDYDYTLKIDFKKTKIKINGWFPENFISQEEKKDFIKVKIKNTRTKKDLRDSVSEYYKMRLDTDVGLAGEILFTDQEALEFYRYVFRSC